MTNGSTLAVSADYGIQPAGKTPGGGVVDSTTSPGQEPPVTQWSRRRPR